MNPRIRLSAWAASLRSDALGPADRAALADTIDRIAKGEDPATALGLKRGPGQRAWHTCEVLAERDELLRIAAGRFFGGLSVAEQAALLHQQLCRYRAAAWQRERACERCPDRHLGTLREFLWRILKTHDHGLSERSLRSKLAMS